MSIATELATSGVNAIENAIVTLVTTGEGNFRDFANSILQDLARILTRAIITANILRALGIGAGGGLTGGGLLSFLAPQAHDGGVAGHLPDRHTGPLRSRETVAVLEKGEEVITRGDPRHRWNFGTQTDASMRSWVNSLPRFHDGGVVGGGRGGSGAGESNFKLEIINQTAQPIEAQAGDQRIDLDGMVQSVIIRDARRNGPITRTLNLNR